MMKNNYDTPSVKRSEGLLKRIIDNKYLLAMSVPGAIWMIVFIFLPMYGILMAFTDYNITKPILSAPWAGMKYFKEYFQDEYFWITIQNTLGISLLKLFIGFPISVAFAIMLNELFLHRYKRVVQTISYLPHFLSWAVLGTIIITWFSEMGPVNDILTKLNVITEPISFMSEPKYFWPLSVGSEIWKETGWNAIIFLAAITGIDPQLYESAELDGATRMQKICNITLPSISNIIALVFILNVGNLLTGNFNQTLILANQLNLDRSLTIDLYVYRTGIGSGRFSYATAIGTFTSFIALILLLIANKTTKKLTGNSMF